MKPKSSRNSVNFLYCLCLLLEHWNVNQRLSALQFRFEGCSLSDVITQIDSCGSYDLTYEDVRVDLDGMALRHLPRRGPELSHRGHDAGQDRVVPILDLVQYRVRVVRPHQTPQTGAALYSVLVVPPAKPHLPLVVTPTVWGPPTPVHGTPSIDIQLVSSPFEDN
uniref:Uncharacterized protein n=1 Tax=Timema bartmani TaxID=61472 RepID=A0A7R9ENY7_9NEOP|nr:unnamed protein product [Timema bartmani]